MVIQSNLPLMAILLPVISSIVIPVLGKRIAGFVNQFTAIITVFIFGIVVMMYPSIKEGQILEQVINTGFSAEFNCRVDLLGFIVGLISTFIWMLASIYSIEYMRNERALIRYNMFSLLSLSGMLGVVFTGNLFSLYLVFELLSVASYVLIIHEESAEAMRSGMVYLFMGIGGGLILLFGILATYAAAGTGDFLLLAGKLKGQALLPHIFWAYIIGFGIKAGLFPLHVWVPSSYTIAPSPASALFSSVMKKAGAYGIVRVIYSIIGPELLIGTTMINVLFVLALISIFFGSAIAISQKELKTMLAYSSIAQIGYIVLGLVLFTPEGTIGGIVHIFNHAFIKSALFLAAGSYINRTGSKNIADFEGIGKRMPVTTLCFTLAGLSMIGFPPFNGFISKWFLAVGSLGVERFGSYKFYMGLIALSTLLLSSLMNLIYYGPVIYRAWFGEYKPVETEIIKSGLKGDPGLYMLIPMIILSFGTLFFGIFPQFPLFFAEKFSESVYLGLGCIK